jgi:hypothetical protein
MTANAEMVNFNRFGKRREGEGVDPKYVLRPSAIVLLLCRWQKGELESRSCRRRADCDILV